MNVQGTKLPGVLLITPRAFEDSRGFFFESFNARRYLEAGVVADFVQDNISSSSRGILRGLHFQHPHGQAKLVQVLSGEVFDVAVDVRADSPTFGHWIGEYLSSENRRQLYIPPGFAHGFLVTSDTAIFAYKCGDYYRPEAEGCVRWDDASLQISWPSRDVILSAKDSGGRLLADFRKDELPSVASPT